MPCVPQPCRIAALGGLLLGLVGLPAGAQEPPAIGPTPASEVAPSIGEAPSSPVPAPPPDPSPLALGALSSTESAIEGELASVGAIGLTPWRNRAGIVIGLDQLGSVFYLSLKPEVNWSREVLGRPFSMTFGLPIRVQMLDLAAEDRWGGIGAVRSQDWKNPRNYAQLIQQVTWGGKEKHFYLDINQFRAASIGHGTILKRYSPNLDMNQRRVSFEFDAFSDWGGGELYLDDITGPHVVGGLGFVKPLSFVDRTNSMMRSFSLGGTLVADVDAPLRNRLDQEDLNHDGRRDTQLAVDPDTSQPRYVAMPVLAYGVDAEVKWIDTPRVDWKMYLDYSFLESGLPTDGGRPLQWDRIPTRRVRSGGFTWGNLLRLNVRSAALLHAFRIRAEYRRYAPNYLPSYFDLTYQLDRVQHAGVRSKVPSVLANQTKLQQVLGRDPDGPWVNGGYLEFGYRVADWFALAFGLEMNDRTPDNHLFLHVEVPVYRDWQFMATYHRRNATGFVDLFRWFQDDTDVFIAKTRYTFAKVFGVALEAITPFGFQNASLLRRSVEVNLALEFGYPYLKEGK